MSPVSRLLSASREFRMAAALLHSGLFDPESYAEHNPDVAGPALMRAWHYVRFGRNEERRFKRGILSNWLVPHLIAGRLGAGQIRRLINKLDSHQGERRETQIRKFCERVGIAPAGYLFWQAYAEGAFDRAETLAGELDGEEAFRAAHRLAVRVLRTRHLAAAFEWGMAALAENSSPQRLAALSDMAEALGRDTPEFNRRLASAYLQEPSAPACIMQDLWRMRMPFIEADTSIIDLGSAIEETPGLDMPAGPALLPESVHGWEAVFAASSWNALMETPARLQADLYPNGSLRGWKRAGDSDGPAIILRLPHATHWLAAGESQLSASFIRAFKTISLAALQEGAIVQPVQSGRIHDVSNIVPADLPVLGYHSVCRNGRKSLHFKEAAIRGYFSLDPSGFSGWASWVQDTNLETIPNHEADLFHKKLHNAVVAKKQTKYRQAHDEPAPEGRFVFLALQVPDDTVTQHASITASEILDTLLEHYADSGTQIAVKPHPYDLSKVTHRILQERTLKFPHLLVSHAPIHALLERADYVVTINSGVGVEALVHLKQVISAGSSDYECATHRVTDIAALKSTLTALDRSTSARIPDDRIKRFLHAAYAQHAFTEKSVPEQCRAMIRRHLLGHSTGQ